MPLPIDNLTTLHLDAATDDPSQAQPELLAAVNKIKELIAAISVTPGIDKILASDANGYHRLANIVGIGTAPDTSHDMMLVTAAQELGEYGLIYSRTGTGVEFARNAKIVAGTWVYRNTGEEAQLIVLDSDGAIYFYTAPVGAAGAVVQFVIKLMIPNAAGAAASIDGGLEINGHPVPGYVKVGTGVYRKSIRATYASLPSTLLAIPAPAAAKGLILAFRLSVNSQNAIGSRFAMVEVFSDAAGTALTGATEAAAREFTATPTEALNLQVVEIIAPVVAGFAYAKLGFSSSGSTATYAIVGYTL